MPLFNEKLLLLLNLNDGTTGKHVRAALKDGSNAAVAGSPVVLTDRGNGVFADNSVSMPNTPFVTAEYTVANDSGFTEIDTSYGNPMDVFPLVTDQSALIKAIATSIAGIGGTDLSITVDEG